MAWTYVYWCFRESMEINQRHHPPHGNPSTKAQLTDRRYVQIRNGHDSKVNLAATMTNGLRLLLIQGSVQNGHGETLVHLTRKGSLRHCLPRAVCLGLVHTVCTHTFVGPSFFFNHPT